MFKCTLFHIFALSLFLGGCAGAKRPVPVTARGDVPSAAELVSKGRAAAQRGDAVRAEQYLGLALKEGANEGAILPVLLEACLKSSHLRAALNHAEPYLLEHPEDDALRYLVANIHVGLGQRAAARRELGLLLERNPQAPDAHYLLGIIETDVDSALARHHFLETIRYTKDEEQKIEVQSRLLDLKVREQQLAEAGLEVQP